MGLFKKRATDPAEMERLKSEIATMAARLDAADHDKQALGEQVHVLSSRLDAVPTEPVVAPPPVAPPTVSEAEVDVLRARVQRLSDRLDETATQHAEAATVAATDPAELDELRSRVDAVHSRLDEAITEQTDDTGTAPIDPAEFAAVRERLDALSQRFDAPLTSSPAPPPPPSITGSAPPPPVDTAAVDDLNDRVDALASRLDDVDARITSISTELANQITELSGDIDGIGDRDGSSDEVVGELRDAQARLASEQARYQIAFREDLAALAERLKRA